MSFLSAGFVIFFLVVLCLYWSVGRGSAVRQNIVLLLAGMFFYGWADLRFLTMILFSAGANYALGVAIEKAENDRRRSLWFWMGIILNIGLLGYFKYFGFFYDSFADALNLAGGHHHHLLLAIALPLGISYYTFQLTGYLIDVYNGTIAPCRKPLNFVTYVMHFPKLLAGPVEPARDFLPRIEKARVLDRSMAVDALRQLLWGVFAKMVIADNCAAMVDPVFTHIGTASGSTLLVGAILYLLQLYGDFSGYSNMAIGLSKLFGIPLMVNFRAPLFVTNIGDFWRRWHISLTTWMMDYVFTPLSFLLRDRGKAGLALSILITFMAVGIWHGANWTFIAFGLLQGIYFLPLVFKGSLLRSASKGTGRSSVFRRTGAMAGMFLLMSLTFVLMRAPDLQEAWAYWSGIFTPSLFSLPKYKPNFVPVLLVFFLFVEYQGREQEHALATRSGPHMRYARLSFYAALLAGILLFGYFGPTGFIYFQF